MGSPAHAGSPGVTALADPDRLRAVARTGLFDEGPVAALDRLARLAARAVGAPQAFVTVIDADTQAVVGSQPAGLEGVGRLPASSSLCRFVVESSAAFLVEDAHAEPFLEGHPAVVEHGTAAYAGFPLRAPTGEIVGSLCVTDHQARRWTADELDVVRELADVAASEIALRQAHDELATLEAEHRAVLETSQDAYVAMRPDGTVRTWSASATRLFGWSEAEAVGRPVVDLVVPDALRAAHLAGLARVGGNGGSGLAGQRLELTARHRDGREFPVEMTMQVLGAGAGRSFHAFLHDISDRRGALRAVEDERSFLSALLDSLDAGVVAADAEGRVTVLNQAVRDLGSPGGVLEGMAAADTVRGLAGPDGRTPLEPAAAPLARTLAGEVVDGEEVVATGAGHPPRRLMVHGRPIVTADGRRLGAVTVLRDVTAARRHERVAEAQHAVAGALAEATTAGGAATATVEAVATAFGWTGGGYWVVEAGTPRYAGGWSVEAGGTDGSAAAAAGLVAEALDVGVPVRAALGGGACVAIPVNSGGRLLGALAFTAATLGEVAADAVDALDPVCAYVGRHLERRRAEELDAALWAVRQDLERLVNLVNDYLWTAEVAADGRWHTVFASPDGSGVFGGQPDDDDLLALAARRTHPEDAEVVEEFGRRLMGGGSSEIEVRLRGYDGVTRWVWTRATTRRVGDRLLVDGISTNVTERHRLAQQRESLLFQERTQVATLRQLDRVKDELVAVVSHELRTPLMTIRGFLELLLDDQTLTAQQREFASVAHATGAQLQHLADELLDAARIESGPPTLHLEPVDLAVTVPAVVETHRPAAAEAGVELRIDCRPAPAVAADAARLRQILDNLLSNAVKYTPRGGRVDVAVGSDPSGAATVAVRDTGIGIPADEYDRLFSRFFRATTAVASGISGTGLGLNVTKALVDAHGGSLRADPAPGGGTVFLVTLPVAADVAG